MCDIISRPSYWNTAWRSGDILNDNRGIVCRIRNIERTLLFWLQIQGEQIPLNCVFSAKTKKIHLKAIETFLYMCGAHECCTHSSMRVRKCIITTTSLLYY